MGSMLGGLDGMISRTLGQCNVMGSMMGNKQDVLDSMLCSMTLLGSI